MKRNSFSSTMSQDRLSPDQLSVISSDGREDLSQSSGTGNNILFFGYGPICNEIVRKRRNIRTSDMQAAFLDGYRLSFDFGGVANVVRQRGYRVHGVLLTLTSLRDFKKLQSYDIRRQVTQRLVFLYPKGGFNYDEDMDTEEEKEEMASAMAYFIEFPEDVKDTLLSSNPVGESLPQEGYLKLIAEGMQQNRVMPEYIEDSILNVPYTPDRTVANYLKFPDAPKVARISFSTYQNLCETVDGEIYFVLGDSVFSLGQHDPNNPLAKWLEEHGHGKGDITFFVQVTLMNPNMTFCRRRSEVTPAHVAWAENQLFETIEQHGLQAMKIFEFVKENESEDGPSKFFTMADAAVPEVPEESSVASHESGGSLEHLNSPRRPVSNKRRFKVSVFFKRMVHRNRG